MQADMGCWPPGSVDLTYQQTIVCFLLARRFCKRLLLNAGMRGRRLHDVVRQRSAALGIPQTAFFPPLSHCWGRSSFTRPPPPPPLPRAKQLNQSSSHWGSTTRTTGHVPFLPRRATILFVAKRRKQCAVVCVCRHAASKGLHRRHGHPRPLGSSSRLTGVGARVGTCLPQIGASPPQHDWVAPSSGAAAGHAAAPGEVMGPQAPQQIHASSTPLAPLDQLG